ncbi:MAG: antibiotic biosynthesis monooxygenase [Planctomycetaceae bacterium]|nr:antibiotic biosynthesis monooxygenase [Planctomycetaceae bacterium]
MICVLATLKTAPGRRDDLLAIFRILAPKVRAEKGCIEYGPMTDAATNLAPVRPDVVTVVEKWESVAALETHLQTPHMVDFRKQTGPMRLTMSLQILESTAS